MSGQTSIKSELLKKIVISLCGCIIFAIAINQLQQYNLGLSAFDSLALSIVNLSPIEKFGNASFAVHFILFVILLFTVKTSNETYKLVLVSLLSIFLITRLINVAAYLDYYQGSSIAILIFTLLFMNFGLYLIARANIIIPPYDKFVVMLTTKSNFSLATVRLACDTLIFLIVIGLNVFYNSAVPISLITIFLTFGTGANIGLYIWLEQHVLKQVHKL